MIIIIIFCILSDHESLPYTPRILQPLLPSRPSTSTSWEPNLTYPAQQAEIGDLTNIYFIIYF